MAARRGAGGHRPVAIGRSILWLLYLARRRDFNGGGLGELQIEQSLGYPFSELEFHLWYLKEKGWVRREDSGLLAITIAGVDKVMDGNTLRNDRLIAEHSVSTEHAGFLLEPASTS